MTSDSYDEIPYDSTPFAETHPDHLWALARLHGVAAADPAGASVLELGCAGGGNIVPLAYYRPGTRVLGIERSAGQVAAAGGLIRRLGLANIEVRQGDIGEVGAELGRFDYIVAHGVYSWVPEPVREHILVLCRELLSENGVAYISYNALPGWRMRGMLRDMLLHHCRHASTPRARLAAAHGLFDLLDRATKGLDALSARYLRGEIAMLRKAHPSYLYHEFLEETNQPFLFSQFAADCARHGLQYLCDAELATAFPSILGDAAEEALEPITDPLEREQYLDFVRNRNFRQSLVCRAERAVNRGLDLEQFERFAFSALLAPAKKPELGRVRDQAFVALGGEAYAVSHPLTKAALLHLAAAYPDAVPFPDLAAAAQHHLLASGAPQFADQAGHLFGELFGLFARQAVRACPRAERFDTRVPARPRLNALARAQAEMNLGHLATARHGTVALDDFAGRLARLLDGSRGVEELAAAMSAAVEGGELRVETGGARIAAKVAANVERLLAVFARQGLFAGP